MLGAEKILEDRSSETRFGTSSCSHTSELSLAAPIAIGKCAK